MRLLLVHGRAQGERSADEIREEWLGALGRGCDAAGIARLPDTVDARVPFYGARLDRLTALPPAGEVVPRGPGGDAPDPFQAELVLELAERAGITDAEIAAESGEPATARGPRNWEWVQAAGRLLSRRSPWLSERVMARFTADVAAYLRSPRTCREINGMVAAELDSGPAVVVGHSLGSVVAYWVLTEVSQAQVPLFVTLGSPLGIPAVQSYLPKPLGMPRRVRHWFNAADERDEVALFARLDRDVFPAEIENVSDLHNPREHPHGIGGYLADRVVARRICQALTVP